jgi:hypothetical protein
VRRHLPDDALDLRAHLGVVHDLELPHHRLVRG